MAQPAPDAAGSGAATAHLPTSVSSQRRVWPVYRRQLDVQHRQGAAAPLQNERAAPAKKERVPILTFRSCASPQESTPSKRRHVASLCTWYLFWRGGALGRMDAHSQEDLLADAAREGEAPKLRHLLRKGIRSRRANRYYMGVSGWPAETAGKYSVRRSGKLYKKRLGDLRTFSRSCAATALAEPGHPAAAGWEHS